jgi:hypothetical protein
MEAANPNHVANLPEWMRMTQVTTDDQNKPVTIEHWVQMFPASGPSNHKQVYAALSLTDVSNLSMA